MTFWRWAQSRYAIYITFWILFWHINFRFLKPDKISVYSICIGVILVLVSGCISTMSIKLNLKWSCFISSKYRILVHNRWVFISDTGYRMICRGYEVNIELFATAYHRKQHILRGNQHLQQCFELKAFVSSTKWLKEVAVFEWIVNR